jgi:hypothetical protein
VARAYALQARTSQGANAARTRALAAYKDLPGNAKHFSGEQRVGTIFILLCCLRRTVISVMQAAESEMRRLFATRFGCFGNRCGGPFGTLDFSHNDGTFHLDTANGWNIPFGTLVHVGVDVILGYYWYEVIPRPWPFGR